jgi:DNA repair photolyase
MHTRITKKTLSVHGIQGQSEKNYLLLFLHILDLSLWYSTCYTFIGGNISSYMEVHTVNHKTFEYVKAKQTLNKVKAERMPFDWSINPYRGCAHGCSFCYARAFQGYIGMGVDEFQNHILIKENAAEALEAQLARMAKRIGGDPGRVGSTIGLVNIGTATDPYQPIEGKQEITRQCLKVLAKYQVPTSITTRSPLILRDLDVLAEVPITSINISINTLNASLTRKLEPATPFPLKRLETVQTLNNRGIRAGAFVAPILPLITDSEEDLEALLAAVKAHQSAFVMTSVLRLSAEVKPWYYQTLQTHFPQLRSDYLKLYKGGAYASKDYLEAILVRTDQLIQKYDLLRDVRVDNNTIRGASKEPSTPQQVEQLSFTF